MSRRCAFPRLDPATFCLTLGARRVLALCGARSCTQHRWTTSGFCGTSWCAALRVRCFVCASIATRVHFRGGLACPCNTLPARSPSRSAGPRTSLARSSSLRYGGVSMGVCQPGERTLAFSGAGLGSEGGGGGAQNPLRARPPPRGAQGGGESGGLAALLPRCSASVAYLWLASASGAPCAALVASPSRFPHSARASLRAHCAARTADRHAGGRADRRARDGPRRWPFLMRVPRHAPPPLPVLTGHVSSLPPY